MKRTLSILLTIAMIISLIPAVFAADVPTMSTTVDKTEVQPCLLYTSDAADE